jgi:ketosteroid isomerase-like protein
MASGVDVTDETNAIRAANQAWFGAEVTRELESIMPYVADSAIFQPPDAPAFRGHEAVRRFYRDFFVLPYTDVGGGPDTIVVAPSGTLAYDIGRNYVTLPGESGDVRHEGKYLAVWEKFGDQWKVVAISWSLNAPMR